MADVQALELHGPGPGALLLLFVLVVVAPVAVTAVALLASGGLARAPGPTVLGAVAAVSVLVYAVLASAAMRREFKITPEGLTVRSSFYKVFVERAAIRADAIRAGDSTHDAACMLGARTNGMSMPGFHSGWFRTRSDDKAFVALTGPGCVLVPTTKGFLLILGVRDPETASRALRASLT